MAMTLTDFLLARIAEDEAVALAASCEGGTESDTSTWWATEIPGLSMRKTVDEPTKTVIDSPGCAVTNEVYRDSFAEHIARHDPARVLAECEAKRRIVGLHTPRCSTTEFECTCGYAGHRTSQCSCGAPLADEGGWGRPPSQCPTVAALASVYADHPDYREEWKP